MKDQLKIMTAVLILVVGFVTYYYASFTVSEKKIAELTLEEETSKKEIPVDGSLFKILARESDLEINYETKTVTYKNAEFKLKPEMMDVYYKIGLLNQSQNSVVVYPIFTEAAYNKNGFYDYYSKKCDSSCMTVPVQYNFSGEYSASRAGFNSLRLLGYHFITDVDIDKNPEILKNYDKVILLHNEYVTKTEFNALSKHPKIIYLYPNALYAEVTSNYNTDTITLVRGHGYPDEKIKNGFDWKFDNSNFEYDNSCTTWKFYEINNGIMLNCYPEYMIFKDESLLERIKNY
ncbi:MAG: hypothetical protein EPO63_04710 [Candidatus Nitrosotenuis sp.]|nr:MAG: hypothetical protein EPO63_04710 [Candidatus Nitrosotenuis sp.]